MKTPSRYLSVALALLTVPSAFSASQTWSNAPVSAYWTNINNWIGLALPGTTNMTGNTVQNDVATFNSPIFSGIGGAANPILTDDATLTNGVRCRQLGSLVFTNAECGAYVISAASPVQVTDLNTPFAGILYLSHNGRIYLASTVTNSQQIMVPIRTRLPSSTAGIYSFVNDSATPTATLYINSATNDSANTRGTEWRLNGSNTGTNTIGVLSAGTTTSGANGLTKLGSGTWILAGPNDFRSQTVVRIQEGTLIVKDPGAFTGPASATVTNTGILQIDGVTLNQLFLNLHNGGTIRMNGSSTLNGVAVGNHTATSVTLATASAEDVFTVGGGFAGGTLVAGGAVDSVLNTAGAGTLVFGTANTYVGRWSFNAATNQITDASALGTGANANVGAGAILDAVTLGSFTPTTSGFGGSGTGTAIGTTAAAVKVDASGTLDLTSKAVNLSFAPTSASGDLTHPALYIAQGTLQLGGNTFFVNNASGTPLGVGTYRLVQQASGNITSGGGYAALVSGSGLAAGTAAEIQVVGGAVNLVVNLYVPKNLVWKGGNFDGTWDLNNTANFLNGVTPSVFNNSDNVTFNAIGLSYPIVTLSGTLAPASVTVDTSANDYTFAGGGQIVGPGSLTKVGPGTLELGTVNTYAGGTTISNGVLRFSTANALPSLGSGDVALYGSSTLDLNNYNGAINGLNGNGSVDNSGGSASELTVGNNDRAGVFSGVLKNTSGTLALTKVGTNTQTLTASNSYSGPTTINLGTVAAGNARALGFSGLTLNAGTLNVQSPQLYVDSLAGSSGSSIANNSTATTNRLVTTGTAATSFSGSISDGLGGGGMALTLLGGTLTMNENNTYTGGTIVGSGATFNIHNSPAGVTGGLIASNGATLGLTGGSGTPTTPTSITTVNGATVSFTAGALGKIWGGQFIGAANTTNRILSTMSFGGDTSFKDFLGVVSFETSTTLRFINIPTGAAGGSDNTTFDWVGAASVVTRDPATVRLGHIRGGSSGGGIDGATGGGLDTYILGGKGVDSTFFGYVRGLNNIVKSGAGRLTFAGWVAATNTDNASYTNYLYFSPLAYTGTTTISNGVLDLVVPNDLSNSPSITLAASTAVLDATKMGYVSNFTDLNGDNSALVTNGTFQLFAGQTLAGLGTIQGNLIADPGSSVQPGLSVGTLAVSGSAALNGTVNVSLNRSAAPVNSGRLAAASFSGSGATLNVTNVGPNLVTGDVYQLFSGPVNMFTTVNLPAANADNSITYTWQNDLAVNGTITVLSGASPVDPTPTNITAVVVGDNTLQLSWPASHTGWTLQNQTNALNVGLSPTWYDVPDSTSTNQVLVPINPGNPTVFYRLRLPNP